MSTLNFTWIDPFTNEQCQGTRPGPMVDATTIVFGMKALDEERSGLAPGEGAGYDLMCAYGEEGGTATAFILQTRGLPPGSNLLVVGRVEHEAQ